MVDHSARVIAVFNGEKSGTKNTVDYRVLPAGTSIEIKITQDESRTNHITGYIPDADYIIP